MNGLDLKTTTLALQNLAKFHAASLAMFEKRPVPDAVKHNFWSEPNNVQVHEMQIGSLTGLIEEVATWTDFSPKYLEKLEAVKKSASEKLVKAAETNESSLNVLLHGDCWINNMMFQKTNGEATK